MGILKDYMEEKDIQSIDDAYASCCYVFTEDELIELCKKIAEKQREICTEAARPYWPRKWAFPVGIFKNAKEPEL